MSRCCDPVAYRREFDERGAERLARAYRKAGLSGTARGLADFLISRGVGGMTLLEVGGGVGDLHIELLEAGALTAVNIELSDGYEGAAAELLAERGLDDRVERRLGDFVTEADALRAADVVILNRVVCCYPWMESMVDAAVAKTGRYLALALPHDHVVSRVLLAVENLVHRILGHGFRAYVHSGVESRISAAGLLQVQSRRGVIWQEMVFERQGAPI